MKRTTLFLLFLLSIVSIQSQREYKAYIVSNSHLDTQWNWDVRTTIDEYLKNTVDRNLYLLRNYPDYIFNFEGAVRYHWLKEYYPLQFEEIKRYIAAGRWHVAGCSWDSNDVLIASPESAFRNALLGDRFYRKEFGVLSRDIFLPDCFGFGYTLPTIASHLGLIGFSTQKVMWRNENFYGDSKVPFNIGLWKGVDGSLLLSALNAQPYVHQWKFDQDISRDKELKELAQGAFDRVAYRYYGTGDKGGSADPASVQAVAKGIWGDGDIQILSSTSDQLYKDYFAPEKRKGMPIFEGELLMDLHTGGCYTSQAAMKLYNRRNEQLGDDAERIAVMANQVVAQPYPSEEMTDTWRRFIWHQFHDDLTGTSIPRAYTYSWNDELIAQRRFADMIHTGVGAITSKLDTRVKGTPVVVYNAMGTNRKEIVEIKLPFPKGKRGVRVYQADGKEVPSQIDEWSKEDVRVSFSADVSPLSCEVYDVRFDNHSQRSSLKATVNSLENSVYKVVLDANGDIASIWDKRSERELVEVGRPYRLALFTENESNTWPAWEIHKKTLDSTARSITDGVRIKIASFGASHASLQVERTYGSSRFVQTIRLSEGAADDRIDVINNIYWNTRNALLKAEFPMSVSHPMATYDLGIGTIQRGNNTKTAFEVYAQQWADITSDDKAYGVTIVNDCKYGWDKPNDNTLRLTLLHAPKSEKRYKHQEEQDFGHHRFTYSIIGHVATPQEAGMSHRAESLNKPLAAFVAPRHKGELGRSYSFLTVHGNQVAVRSLKKAEDNDCYIVRLYELQGKEAKDVMLSFPVDLAEAYEVNALEERVGPVRTEGNKLRFDVGSYAPKTFAVRFRLGRDNTPVRQVQTMHLALPFNEQAFTPEHFGYLGAFDAKGNSFAAELIGDTVVSGGIPFRIASREEKNVLKCNGDTLFIPSGRENRKLYFLAAATHKDTTAVFRLDDRSIELSVPCYSGFYGQWGQTGFSKGFAKRTPIAYIGSHRHTKKGNESYLFTFLYRFQIDLSSGAQMLILPKDKNIALFAATLSDDQVHQTIPVRELVSDPQSEIGIIK